MTAVEDPFAHLHDEAYAEAFAAQRSTWRDAITLGDRPRESLGGEWFFTLDLFDEGLRQRWYADEPTPAQDWRVPRDYDAGAGETFTVPGCFTVAKPEWRHFEGGAWYTRTLDLPALPSTERLFLRLGAANYEARIFLNGTFIRSHRGGSTPIFAELTGHVQAGANRLQIQVDNRRRPSQVPMDHFDWFNDGGLYREVDLIRLPAVFLRRMSLALVPGSDFQQIRARVSLSDPQAGEARVVIPELGINAVIPLTAGEGESVVTAEPQLWSPLNPKLYDVIWAYGAERITERVGFRELRTDGPHILLNGYPIYLKGLCVHEDDVVTGRMTSDADIRRRLTHAQELGCTVLRLAHYPHHERVAELADEMGLMLWCEIPVYWAIDFANPETYADAENQLLEMIARDENRASVILWGVGNENADTEARYQFMARLAAAARAADSTRLIGAACLINREKFCIEDRLTAHLDVIGINEYFGWYEPDFGGLERLLANSHPDRPVVISETGADALAGHHGRIDELFTEECQAEIFRRQVAILAKTPWVQGLFPWLLYDFRSERRQTVFQRGLNRKGLIAEDKTTKKQAFYVLADYYRSR